MFRFCLMMMLAAPAFAGDPLYELLGRLAPEGRAMVSLPRATSTDGFIFGICAPARTRSR
jgi:hypothetical protein